MTNGDGASWATLSLNSSLTNNSGVKKYTLSTTENTIIGRSPDCQIPLNPHEFATVSRRHAEIKLVNANWQISDLETTNGTLVNDRPVSNSQQLESGDRITLGVKGAEFTFECLTLDATVMVRPEAESESEDKPKSKPIDKPAPDSDTVARAEKIIPSTPESKLPSVLERDSRSKPVTEASVAESEPITSAKSEPNLEPRSTARSDSSKTAPTASVSQQSLFPVAQSAGSNKTLWSLVSTTEIAQISGHSQPVLGIAFSPDEQILATTAKDKTIKLWNIADGTEIATLTGHRLAPNAVVFSPDGKTLASGGADKTIKLWNVADGAETASFAGHKLAINALAFSPDGKTLASGGADKTIKLWDVASQSETASFAGHKLAIESLAFSADGQTIASGSKDKTVKLWNVASQSETAVLRHKQGITVIGFSPDGQTIASGSTDKTIKLWNRETQTEIVAIATPSWQTGAIAIAPNGQTFAGSDEQGVIRLWQI